MLFSYVSIINTVKRGNAMSAEGDLTDRQRKIERDVTIVSRSNVTIPGPVWNEKGEIPLFEYDPLKLIGAY